MIAGVIGHFGNGHKLLNGQTVKTKIVTDELCRALGDSEVLRIDTHGGKKTLIKAPFQVISALKKCKNVIILPAHNGLRVYAPLLAFFNSFFKRKLHYMVIGGWLPEFLQGRASLARCLGHFDGIYVETNTMKRALEDQGFDNVFVAQNCKRLDILKKSELVYPTDTPYRLCTFSRVMREKGIEDAADAVRTVNDRLGYTAFSLDIYGQVDAGQTEWFETLSASFPDYIRYVGAVDADKSVSVLADYFALLFPTRFYTEGIPGTIIDAYAAGLPVIAAKWESYGDMVVEGKSGFGYEFGDKDQLVSLLLHFAEHPDDLLEKKPNCLDEAEKYRPEAALAALFERLES